MLHTQLMNAYKKNQSLLYDFVSTNKKNMCYPEKLFLKHVFDIVVNPELSEKDRYNTSDIRMLSYDINGITQEVYILHTDIQATYSSSGSIIDKRAIVENKDIVLSGDSFIATRFAFTEQFTKELFRRNMDEIPSGFDIIVIMDIAFRLLENCTHIFISGSSVLKVV